MDAFQSCTLAPPDDALISVIKKTNVLGPFLFKALMITTWICFRGFTRIYLAF